MRMKISELNYWVGKISGYIEGLNKRLNET